MKQHRFYGHERVGQIHSITKEYPRIHTPLDLYDALREIWCASTCAPRLRQRWTEDNCTLGQCSITSFLAQDIFGGEVMAIPRPGGTVHCFNRIGDVDFDLTSEQYKENEISYEIRAVQSREQHFAKEEKRLRYEYLKAKLKEECDKALFATGEFGLEKESIRVTLDGHMAQTFHPFPGDSKRDRDFCESQMELITDVHCDVSSVIRELQGLTEESNKKLLQQEEPEMLWPFSNPPIVENIEDVQPAYFTGADRWKEEYRNYLAGKYGKRKMLFSGIHFNYSFTEEFLQQEYGRNKRQCSYEEYKNETYLDLARKLLKRAWILVYLMAASPVFDRSYFQQEPEELQGENEDQTTMVSPYASPRCGREGYWNSFQPILNFSSVKAYADSIRKYIREGLLQRPSELYYPIRLKPKGIYSMENLEKGISHIELRMFDLNPLADAGIEEKDLQFTEYLMKYLFLLPKEDITEEEQLLALENLKESARLQSVKIRQRKDDREAEAVQAEDAALALLDQVEKTMLAHYPSSQGSTITSVMDFQRDKIRVKDNRYADRIIAIYGDDYVGNMLSLNRR